MKTRSVWVGSILVALGLAVAAPAQEMLRLRDRYVAEARMLDVEIDAFLAARAAEAEALDTLVALNSTLDAALADPAVLPAELIRLDAEIETARQEAFARSVEAGERRRQMGQRMRSLQEIAGELQAGGVRFVEPNEQVGGSWLIETGDVLGLLSLEQRGAGVTGLYRTSNGRHGSVSGSFAGDRLRLTFVDSEWGTVVDLEGVLESNGELIGQWTARELAAGRPTGGRFRGRLLSLEDIFQFEP